jgi:hypothetical protein
LSVAAVLLYDLAAGPLETGVSRRETLKGAALTRFLGALAVSAIAVASSAVAEGTAGTTAATVAVTITDQSLRVMPTEAGSGMTTFVVRNSGRKPHMLAIAGPGLKNARTARIAAGKDATLTVTLRTGTYMLYDPVGLSTYTAEYIDVTGATTLTGTGTSNVANPSASTPGMCGVFGP